MADKDCAPHAAGHEQGHKEQLITFSHVALRQPLP